jgi:hypothetical protein
MHNAGMMAMSFLYNVADRFLITGRGVIIVARQEDLRSQGPGSLVGKKIRLIRPDKTEIETHVSGQVFEHPWDIVLPPNIEKNDVPVGTEVWVID